ncbi:RNA-guided endonuclease InsQ/TnpB family protein [Streptomyces sp. NBC_01236]|uniref:RNA-guided endonuclease InsQ/TnpB family protein n=1 Tax=Streptomyces sp. NBC_01236 TaxID=2903789 RepID=UPI002E136869|nr:transposase [Streptomyces sp. NBC_01236]
MKLVVQVKLLPTPEQAAALDATLRACNEAAAWVSGKAHALQVFGRTLLQQCAYAEVRARGLSAQPSLHVLRKVADAYTALHAQVKAGLLGGEHSPRRAKALAKPIEFRPHAAQPFDDRCLSWQMADRTVSIWTVAGRMKNVAFTGEPEQLSRLAEHRQGESDLVLRNGKWFLVATCEIPERPLNNNPSGFVGVDRGIVNLATTSDGDNHQGRKLCVYRKRMARQRAEIQAKGTKSAKRKLKERSRREARHASHTNHKIAKEIVAEAQRTGRGIALEDLGGIRERVRLRRPQRATLSSWPFHQLGEYVAYKAQRAGVPVVVVDPAYTSQTCPRCGHVDKRNRSCRDWFACMVCGLAGPADHVAAVNVRQRANAAWAFVSTPNAAVSPTCRRGQSRAASQQLKHTAPVPGS